MSVNDELLKYLSGFEISPEDRGRLAGLAGGEIEKAGITGPLELNDPLKFGGIVKAVRLSGEWPLYLAKIAALGLGTAAKEDVKGKVSGMFALPLEREFHQQVLEAYEKLPALELCDENIRKNSLVKEAYRKGYYYEKDFRGCCQCALAAMFDITGKQNDEMFRATNSFAAGMALMHDGVCGGYSGGLLSLGMYAGRRREFFDGDKEQKDLNLELTAKLHEKFIKTYGTVICKEIHKEIFDRNFFIRDSQSKEEFEQAGAHSLDKCPAVVGAACAWTTEILYDSGFIGG